MRLFDCPEEDVKATADDEDGELVEGLELFLPSAELLVGVLCPSDFGVTGTSGGISFGGGVRKDEDLLVAGSLLGDPDCLSSAWDSRPSLLLVDFPLGDSVFLPPSWATSFFSIGGMMGLEGPLSLPILLHVCASKANGLFFASSYNTRNSTLHQPYAHAKHIVPRSSRLWLR